MRRLWRSRTKSCTKSANNHSSSKSALRASGRRVLIVPVPYNQKKAMPAFLDQIVAATRRKMEEVKRAANLDVLERHAERHVPRGVRRALAAESKNGVAFLAGLKQGALPTRMCSVDVRAVGLAGRAKSADGVLLMVAALSQGELTNLVRGARERGLDVLCEVHDGEELARALDAGCDLIGVNSRDLRTFKVDLETAFRLAESFPEKVVRVAESGIASGVDITRLQAAGDHAFLVWESLFLAERPGQAPLSFVVT